MKEQKSIGGFFELEIVQLGHSYHPNALALTNGRACLSWILDYEKPSIVYIPYYVCSAIYMPMEKIGIKYVFYEIDIFLNPINLPEPQEGELLILINYYGLKNKFVNNISKRYGKRVVIDDTHHFFNRGYPNSYSFTSARKYFGVPDGAYLYGASNTNKKIDRNTNISVIHNVKRLIGLNDEAYEDYIAYEASLGYEIKRISILSEKLLSCLNYSDIASKRSENFNFIHEKLKEYNKIPINISEINVPFCYPFLPENYINKKLFHNKNLFIPTFWPDILERKQNRYIIEKDLVKRLLPLPIDQRYNIQNMKTIINFIQGEIN